jgi:hypothetical protein
MEKVVHIFDIFKIIFYFKKILAREGPFWIGQILKGFAFHLNLFKVRIQIEFDPPLYIVVGVHPSMALPPLF